MDRPVTTLFMLMSADGKISTGASDALDFDQDLPRVPGVREGLHQYYEIEQTTDLWSLNSGRVQAKIGVNTRPLPEKSPVSFVLVDNSHLTRQGVAYFAARAKRCVIATCNPRHPAFDARADNLRVIFQETLDLPALLRALRREEGCERITIQTGGTLNGLFLRQKLLDYVDIVIAPVLVGGRDTATLVDGASLLHPSQLEQLGALKLESAQALEHSYVRLRYRVIA